MRLCNFNRKRLIYTCLLYVKTVQDISRKKRTDLNKRPFLNGCRIIGWLDKLKIFSDWKIRFQSWHKRFLYVFAIVVFHFKNEIAKNKIGRSERIWTFDPLVPNQVRYQAAPRSERNIVKIVELSLYDIVQIVKRVSQPILIIPNLILSGPFSKNCLII